MFGQTTIFPLRNLVVKHASKVRKVERSNLTLCAAVDVISETTTAEAIYTNYLFTKMGFSFCISYISEEITMK